MRQRPGPHGELSLHTHSGSSTASWSGPLPDGRWWTIRDHGDYGPGYDAEIYPNDHSLRCEFRADELRSYDDAVNAIEAKAPLVDESTEQRSAA